MPMISAINTIGSLCSDYTII